MTVAAAYRIDPAGETSMAPSPFGTPVTFGRSMGMLHAGHAPVAVLMLGPIGYEELCLRATWRSLAQAISDKGIACLRFDYPGQGDAHEAADVQGLDDWFETIRAADGRVLRRVRILPDGTEAVLFDDTQASPRVEVSELPRVTERNRIDYRDTTEDSLARALAATGAEGVNRSFSLAQVRNIDAVRHLVPEITVDTINFETNSAAIRPEEAQALAALGQAMRRAIAKNPAEVFLIEGHTDAVGRFAYNLALSDRRAESVALALTEYFAVPPENLVLQGYGEGDLLVRTDEAERANRRAAVRRITPLLAAR